METSIANNLLMQVKSMMEKSFEDLLKKCMLDQVKKLGKKIDAILQVCSKNQAKCEYMERSQQLISEEFDNLKNSLFNMQQHS